MRGTKNSLLFFLGLTFQAKVSIKF